MQVLCPNEDGFKRATAIVRRSYKCRRSLRCWIRNPSRSAGFAGPDPAAQVV